MESTKRLNLKIILVEPNGAINVGSVARLCSNFNVSELRFVSPKCNIHSVDAKKMAMKGINYIKESSVYKSLSLAISDCDLVIATTGRIDNSREDPPHSINQISNWVNSYKGINNLALVFGREDRGLTNKELLMAQRVYTININKNHPSLNLSHAVSIVLFELQKFPDESSLKKKIDYQLASSNQIEDSFLEIEKLLLKIGYIMPHTSNAKISKFKKYILKAQTSDSELNIIRGIVHQINWALKNREK